MIRLFVAMHIPFNIREMIFNAAKEITPDFGIYRWEKIEKVHLTLKFIGGVEEKYVKDIEKALSFIENYNKFHFRITGFNFFYRFKNPQILWLGLGTDDPIKKLVRDIEDALAGFSIPREKRDFKSHLTILRIRDNPGQEFIDAFKNYKMHDITFASDKVSLVQSILKPSGSEYNDLKVFQLK